MAETRYSKKVVSTIIEEGEEVRRYKLNTLGAREVSVEGFKLLRAMTPSFGAAMDAFKNGTDDVFATKSQTFSEMLYFLSENLTIEHYETLVDKLLGSLIFDSKEVEDWADHFDLYPQDLLEILAWAGQQSFESFFLKSTIIAPLKKTMLGVMVQMKEELGLDNKTQKTDSNEE